MKTKFYTGKRMSATNSFRLLITLLALVSISATQAQIYYSSFASTADKYNSSDPSGCTVNIALGAPPTFTSVPSVVTADLGDYASISSTVSLSTLCSNPNYTLRAKISLPAGVTEVPAGYIAGFRVWFGGITNVAELSSLTLTTYRNGDSQETVTGANLVGVNSALISGPQNVYFTSTMPFDEVEIDFNTGVLALSLGVDFRFYFAFGSPSAAIILPIKLTSFAATTEGKNVRLNWASSSEVNAAKYELERSNDGGRTFTTVGSVAAKGNSSNETKYSFIDGSILGGEYLYRLKMIDKDGLFEYSKLASIKSLATATWKVYPTMLHTGATLNVSVAANSGVKTEVRLSNLQGQTVKTLTTNDGRLAIPTSNLTGGMYVVKLYQNGQLLAVEKVIIQ